MTTRAAASPAGLITTAMANARAQRWAHIVTTDHIGATTATYAQDSGPAEGEQDIQGAGIVAKVIVVNGTAYIQGNSQAVTEFFGLPKPYGPTLAGRWISISPSDSGYSTVTAGVSLASALDESGLTGPLTESPRTTRQGQPVVGIRGDVPSSGGNAATGTLYISATGHPLPVEFDAASSHVTDETVFSDWGKSVQLSEPAGALPIASIPTS